MFSRYCKFLLYVEFMKNVIKFNKNIKLLQLQLHKKYFKDDIMEPTRIGKQLELAKKFPDDVHK